MQTLNPIASEFPEIDFYVVAYNEPADAIEAYIEENGYTDVIAAQPVGTMLADLEITRQMAMMAVNADGVLYHRQLMGSADQWSPQFTALTADPHAVPTKKDVKQEQDKRLMDLQLPA